MTAPSKSQPTPVGAVSSASRFALVQQDCRRTGTRDRALFYQGFLRSCIGAEAGGAAGSGVLALNPPVQHALGGGIAGDFFIGQDGHQAFLQGSKAVACGLGATGGLGGHGLPVALETEAGFQFVGD